MKTFVRQIPVLAIVVCVGLHPSVAMADSSAQSKAVNAFIEACLSKAPDFSDAKEVYATHGIAFGTSPAKLMNSNDIYAISRPMDDPEMGSVCGMTIRGNFDMLAAKAVLKKLRTDFHLRGEIQRHVRSANSPFVDNIRGEYEVPGQGTLTIHISERAVRDDIGRITALSVLFLRAQPSS